MLVDVILELANRTSNLFGESLRQAAQLSGIDQPLKKCRPN
jgi:hypothetical protein